MPECLKTKWFAGFMLLLVVWGLTDVRSRASFDPEHPTKHRTDFTVFTEAGAAFFDGRDPYEVSNPRGWQYPYPPLFAQLVSPLHTLDPQWQGVVWFFLSLGMGYGCFLECRRLLVHFLSRAPSKLQEHVKEIGWYSFFAVLVPAFDCLQRGQMGLVKTWLLLAGFRWVCEGTSPGKWFLGGMIVVLPAVIKVLPIVPAGFLIFLLMAGAFRSREESMGPRFGTALAGMLAGLFLFVFLIPATLTGWEGNMRHLNRWMELVGTKSTDISHTSTFGDPFTVSNQSLSNALFWSGNVMSNLVTGADKIFWTDIIHPEETLMGSEGAKKCILAIRLFLGLMLVPTGWYLAKQGTPLQQVAVWGLACVATLIVSPMSRGHYFIMEVAAFIFVPLALIEQGRLRQARFLSRSFVILVLLHYLFKNVTGPLGVLGIGSTLWYVFACIYLVRPAPALSGISENS